MGKLLPSYKYSLIEELQRNILANTTQYYGFAANPVPSGTNAPTFTSNYDNIFYPSWQLLFGKKINGEDILPVTDNNLWVSGTIYPSYDNTKDVVTAETGLYYVVVEPSEHGGQYDIFLCIDNNDGGRSTSVPNIRSVTNQTYGDGYVWRYLTSISFNDYIKFASLEYVPVYPNTTIVAAAPSYSGIDKVVFTNSGNGYITHANGIIISIVNTTCLQINNLPASATLNIANDFYTNSGMYISNPETGTADAQYFGITKYVSNTDSGNLRYFVSLSGQVNTAGIVDNHTNFYISPRVVFQTDAVDKPIGYAVINTTSDSVNNVVIVSPGSGVSWCNVSFQSNSYYPPLYSTDKANAYVVVPPAGGHGYNIYNELQIKGLAINFSFANSENGKISTDCTYNRIGLLKNPYNANVSSANSTSTVITQSSTIFSNNAFNQILTGTISYKSGTSFTIGDTVTGSISKCLGTVVFSNSTNIGLSGDKNFVIGEDITSSDGLTSATITINKNNGGFGDIYAKDLDILYIENTRIDVPRTNVQTESYKLLIKI